MSSFAMLTNTGRNKEAAALATGVALNIVALAWGDGDRIPAGGETSLLNEQGRKPVQAQGLVSGSNNTAFFDILLDENEGPFVIREAGLFDVDGDLIAIAKYDPVVNKPLATVSALLRINIVFSDLENLVLQVHSTNAFVPAERKITAGVGLQGGGPLDADISLNAKIPTEAEAVAGVKNDALMTPLRTQQALVSAIANLATKAELATLSGSALTVSDINAAITAWVGGAPDALNTLVEIADKLAEDDSAIAALVSQISGKLPIGGTAADASKLGGALAANYARTDIPETFHDTVIVKGNAHFGEEGGGNTDVYFWDDTAKVWRVMHWNNAGQDWYVHDKNNVLRKVHHDGNSDFLPSSGGNVTGNLDVEGGNLGVNAFNAGANAHLWLRDENGDPMGILFWDRAGSSVKLMRYNPTTGAPEGVFKVLADEVQFNGNTLWHAGNDGGGSGLAADLLDGWHGSQFMLRTDLATLGAINTTAFMDRGASTAVSVLTAGTIVSAALLYYCDRASGRDLVNRPSGLWRCTGYAANFDRGTTFVRVS